MEGSFTLRKATPADADAIAALLQAAFDEYESLYTREAFTATVLPVDRLRTRMAEGKLWVAEHQAKTIGTTGVISAKDSLMLRGMAVHPLARGLGVARTLLSEVEDFARKRGDLRLSLFTAAFLTPAIRLYESFGFKFTGETDSPHGTKLLRMIKLLDGKEWSPHGERE
jgi:GNAT superfamily N-acetyltransferase